MSKHASNKTLSATSMRHILSASLVLIIIAMAGGFYIAYSSLGSYAQYVAETQLEAGSSEANLSYLQSLQKQLDDHRETMKKATNIVAESESYKYQNQVIEELTRHANIAGIQINSFNFSSGEAAGSSAQPAPATDSPAEPAPTTEPEQPEATTASPSSVTSTTVMVDVSENMPYANLMHFLHLIEENLTRMQITELSLTPGLSGTVSTNTLNIEVYIK